MSDSPDTYHSNTSSIIDDLLLLQVYDSIDKPIYLCDPDTYEILYINQALRSLLGESLGQKCYKIFQNLDSPCPFCTNKFIFGKNTGKTHIWEFQNKVNHRWYHCIDRAVPWTNGKMVRYEMVIDITKQKKNELENKQKTEDLSLLTVLNEAVNRGDSLSDIITLLGQETRKTFSSYGIQVYLLDEDDNRLHMQNVILPQKAIEHIENLLGMEIPEVTVLLKEDSEYLNVLKGKKPVTLSNKTSIVTLMKEHTENPILKSLIPRVIQFLDINHVLLIPVILNDKPFGLLEVSRKEPFPESDISRLEFLSKHFITILKRKLVDDALRDSEEHYRILAESANDTIFFIDKQGSIQYVNKIGAKYFRKDPEDIIGKCICDFLPADKTKETMEKINAIITAGKPLNSQNHFRSADGTVWLDTNLVPIKDGKGNITSVMGISRDITEQKKAETEKEEMRNRLFEAEKIKAISVLTGGIAHDINNMLTAINSFANVVMGSTDKTAQEYESLEQICRIVGRANKLTDKLLGFSRKHPAELKIISINEILDDLKKLLYTFIRNGITLTLDLDPAVGYCKADTHKIEQVVMNLVMNAKDAMSDSGDITIKTENVTLHEDEITGIPAGKPGTFICLSVKDTGDGIEEENMKNIFEPFFTTKPNGKGTGLGLSVVNDIVSQHDGFITVDSKPGTGTEFKVFLPAVSA